MVSISVLSKQQKIKINLLCLKMRLFKIWNMKIDLFYS